MVQDRDAGRRAHYDGVRFHDLRHTCAALLIAAGRHMEEVKDYLGHSSIRVTSDRYGHSFPKARAELAAALDATYRDAKIAQPADLSRTSEDLEAITKPPNRLKTSADLRSLLERTTGFEAATPTLARLSAHFRDQP